MKKNLLWFIVFVFVVIFVHSMLPMDVVRPWHNVTPMIGVDWKIAFRPAIVSLFHGQSPFNTYFYNPPWILLPLAPVALFSVDWGIAILFVLNLACFLLVAFKLGMKPLAFAVFVLASGIILNSIDGNIEGVLALGFILPPWLGLFLVLAKPQFGVAVAVFWAFEMFREGGIVKVAKTFLPVSLAFGLSFLIWGFWPAHAANMVNVGWNMSIFPWGVPVGIILLGVAVWKRDIRFAMAASPFFAPYATRHTWAVVWLGLLLLMSRFNLPFEMRLSLTICRWLPSLRGR